MNRHAYAIALMLVLCLAAFLQAETDKPAPSEPDETHKPTMQRVKGWFPGAVSLNRLESQDIEQLWTVLDEQEGVQGWVFRTDRMPPRLRGMRGPIGAWVGVDRNRVIQGIAVVEHREDANWFNRIGQAFYRQFVKLPASREPDSLDTVTGATVSSGTLTRDVLLSTTALLEREEVKPLLLSED